MKRMQFRTKKRLGSRCGIALLEVVFACGILAFSLTAVVQSMISVATLQAQSRVHSEALSQLLNCAEESRRREVNSINDITNPSVPWDNWIQGLGLTLLPEGQINVQQEPFPSSPLASNLHILVWTYQFEDKGHSNTIEIRSSVFIP